MIIITKMYTSNGDIHMEEIARHDTNDFRRIVRKYKYEWDFTVEIPCMRQKAIIIKPVHNDSVNTRLHIEFIPQHTKRWINKRVREALK